ncbi:MAG: class I SAM-dependent methyltransferase [Candidatus Lokiarchaeota archaeon]|nr:class I SAM-dependent methyltransferase [Candidatus Lokiarchaeota archaeon]
MPKKESLDRDYYFGERAEFYAKSKWMARNQIKSTRRALELLENEKIGGIIAMEPHNMLILDIGCGSGFSTQMIEMNGFQTIGIDNSFDMLEQNRKTSLPISRNVVCGIIEKLPFRNNLFDAMISISAFNFILEHVSLHNKKDLLKLVAIQISNLSKDHGRVVIEFYPKKEEIPLYMEAFKQFFEGGLVIDNPNQRKEQKFLILKIKKNNEIF